MTLQNLREINFLVLRLLFDKVILFTFGDLNHFSHSAVKTKKATMPGLFAPFEHLDKKKCFKRSTSH